MYQAKNLVLTFNGIKMDYITFGRGTKPLVLISGLSTQRIKGTAFQISYAYRMFGKNYKVYMFDRKDTIKSGYSISDMATELAQAMIHLNLEKADVIGISQGGMIALSLAANYPKLVNKLVLGVTLYKVNDKAKETIGHWIKLAQNNERQQMILDMMDNVYSERYVKRNHWLIHLMSKLMKPKELGRFIILAESILKFDASEQLKEIICPAFVIGGAKDKVVGNQSSAELAKALDCESYIYSDLGHSAYIEAKDFNQRILQFLLS